MKYSYIQFQDKQSNATTSFFCSSQFDYQQLFDILQQGSSNMSKSVSDDEIYAAMNSGKIQTTIVPQDEEKLIGTSYDVS